MRILGKSRKGTGAVVIELVWVDEAEFCPGAWDPAKATTETDAVKVLLS